jgi:hypothetical protein
MTFEVPAMMILLLMPVYIKVSGEHTASIFSPENKCSSEILYLPTSPHGVTNEKKNDIDNAIGIIL